MAAHMLGVPVNEGSPYSGYSVLPNQEGKPLRINITGDASDYNSGQKAGGFLDKLGAFSSAINPFLGAATSIIGGLLGRKGAKDANQLRMQLAREQMRFQERMSSTAYQRARKDMAAAGLNPILALGKPSSTPQGAMPQVENEMAPVVSSALEIARTSADLRRVAAETKRIDADTDRLKKVTELTGINIDQAQQILLGLKNEGAINASQYGKIITAIRMAVGAGKGR